MPKFSIPTCYFPSTILFVDDSREFLINFTLQLADNVSYRTYDSPFEALEALQELDHRANELMGRCVSEYHETTSSPLTNQTVNLDLSAIHSEVYNPNRFSEVSVVVVDYSMPGMHGIEFCEQIKNEQVQKILLTGQADEKLAVDAFNEGVIQRYIQKSHPNILQHVLDNIAMLQAHYFQNMSEIATQMLAVSAPVCLQDAAFADAFRAYRVKHHVVEFYLLESSGSFLMLTEQGEISFFIVKSEQDLQMYYDLANDVQAPKTVLEQLAKGDKIPIMADLSREALQNQRWEDCLLPAQRMEGRQTYYYAVTDCYPAYPIDPSQISSYRHYLTTMDYQPFAN
ncbi:MAG: response regulator [Legionellales bacterium]|nr:response regulator [Legionellales bacterium]